MNFTGKWLTKNGETYVLQIVDRPGGLYASGDEIYRTETRDDLRWDSAGNATREETSVYKYYETQWNRAPEFDLMERISEKDLRK